jgi:hypothetical protein
MQIYVGKSGQQLGPFSLEEVNRKLADGTFAGTDLAWYEGAAGWAPLSGVPGAVIPAAAPPTPAPMPATVQPAPAIAPIRPNTPIVQAPAKGTGSLSTVAWVLMGITLVVSFIPLVGCGAWLLGLPVAIASIVLGIVILTRGRTGQGMFVILGAVLLVPLCFAAQFASLMVFGGTMERKDQTQIKDNLVTIDSAKSKWVAETKASNGTPVTMESLKSQLGGKEVKPVTGETYDPMPVGQAPTATLPANKTLGTFSGGDVLTVASLETALANSSAFKWNFRKTTTVTPALTPIQIAPSPTPTPTATAAPSVTVSPKPSVAPSISPKSTPGPRSLISPRQQEEPEETPSSRPSPSAKFAPRTAPRRSAPPSENRPDSDNSGGPKQGRQQPRDSSSPAPSPDDDDE